MWGTVFVFNHGTELRPATALPAFTKAGEVLLYHEGLDDCERIPCRYIVTQVIFDVGSSPPKQYVHLQEAEI